MSQVRSSWLGFSVAQLGSLVPTGADALESCASKAATSSKSCTAPKKSDSVKAHFGYLACIESTSSGAGHSLSCALTSS